MSEHMNVLSCSESDKVDQIPMENVNPIVDQDQYLWEEVAAVDVKDSESDSGSVNFKTDGLRVLAVDDSLVCLRVLVALLHQFKYNVTETTNPVEALQILRMRKHEFDIVITDLRMLEMDGLVLLQKISLEMDLPVVMLSADDKQENIMKAIRYGARDYIIKPPQMAQIQYIWQHVVRKHLFGPSCKNFNNSNNNTSSVTLEEEKTRSPSPVEVSKRKQDQIDGREKGKVDEDTVSTWNYGTENADSGGSSKKKRRVNWTVDLHNKFIDAIEKIGPNAVPMEILKVMNVPWLTRANVASHLQKFKNALRSQVQSAPQARNGYTNSINSQAGQNGYQSSLSSIHASYSTGMMTQAIGTNNYFPQKFSYQQQNNGNSRIFPQVTNKHILNQGQHYNLSMNQSAYPAPTMLNNAPLPPRNILTSNPPMARFNGLRNTTICNNMSNTYSLSQPSPAPTTPASVARLSAFGCNIPAATSSIVNANSKKNDTLANGQNYAGLAPETDNMHPQLEWTAVSDLQDTLVSNSNTKTSNLNVDPFQTLQMETWSITNNTNVEVHNFHSTEYEELPIDSTFEPVNTNLSNEDDNDEFINIVNSFNFEGPPSLSEFEE